MFPVSMAVLPPIPWAERPMSNADPALARMAKLGFLADGMNVYALTNAPVLLLSHGGEFQRAILKEKRGPAR